MCCSLIGDVLMCDSRARGSFSIKNPQTVTFSVAAVWGSLLRNRKNRNVIKHHDKMTNASCHHKQMKDFVRAEILV